MVAALRTNVMSRGAAPFDLLLDRAATRVGAELLDLPEGSDVITVAHALESLLLSVPAVESVVLVVGNHEVGVSSRQHVRQLGATRIRDLGDGDGAVLPGESVRYEIVRFHCPVCGNALRRIHVDSRSAPDCPRGHGPMSTAE